MIGWIMRLLFAADDKRTRGILMLPSSGGTTTRAPRRVRTRLAALALGAAGALAIAAVASCGSLASTAPPRHPVAARLVSPVQLPYFPPARAHLPYFPPTRILKEGMSGADVLAMQHRLAALHYWVPAFTGTLSYDNMETLYAFQAVNGLKMTGEMDAATGQALINPQSYTPRDTRVATRIEVDINSNKQLLVYYKDNSIALISHISSGRLDYAITPTGTYTANFFMPGTIPVPLGVMYNPVFFLSTVYAIHGDTQVPNYPDSNGCVRIPIDLSEVFYKKIDVADINGYGTQIYIYGANWQPGS
jgi:L,D-transpeptidase catalytic domain/Putative peptidoglycan binding domain